MSKHYDYLIVGQGLAGSVLYHFLSRKEKNAIVIDQYNPQSSSNIAAGIIHPITGRRMVKTWMADILIPFAEQTYSEIENHLEEKLFLKKNILELIVTSKERNDWNNKTASGDLNNYLDTENTDALYNDILVAHQDKISIKSGWLNISKMIDLFRKELAAKKNLLEEQFDFNALKVVEQGISYKEIEAEKVIFCEGAKSLQNPFWKHLPFLPSKGEVLTIHSNQLKLEHILTRTIFILPLGENLYKVGSTFSWNELNEIPTKNARENLLARLEKIITVPFEVVDHQAAIRPTVKDRRPFIGLHHEHNQVGIFNGLGTKGVLLAPFFANHFTDYLAGNTELMKEVDVRKFS
jgi:glycine oxidase